MKFGEGEGGGGHDWLQVTQQVSGSVRAGIQFSSHAGPLLVEFYPETKLEASIHSLMAQPLLLTPGLQPRCLPWGAWGEPLCCSGYLEYSSPGPSPGCNLLAIRVTV